MGKTPKKATPGGDERNLYNRRLKATTAPPNPSETSLHKRQRESKIPNRSKLSTLQKRVPHSPRKNFKNKVCMQSKLSYPTKKIIDLEDTASGNSKEKIFTIPERSEESILTNMQPESEEADVKINPTVQMEYVKKDISKDTQESDEMHIDYTSSELVSISKVQEDSTDKEVVIEEEQVESQEKASNFDKDKEIEQHEENDLNLRLETEDNPVHAIYEEKADDTDLKNESSEKCPSEAGTTKSDVQQKEDLHSESQTDTESNSVDILEITTSEMSETSETASQNDVQKEKEKEKEKREESVSKDVSFVSYDSSIMLKDVQIKLNDCLKENSKLFDTSNASHNTSSQPQKEMSFGKTLRSITGRRSLNTMRHITLREQRYSPNDSLFVNTSSASLPPDDVADYKIVRYSTDLSDVLSTTNGSPTERKRKHEIDNWSSIKKQKTESENSLLNSSIGLLKGLRKPIQVSTPVSEMKFQTDKLELDESSKSANEGSKKWCVIM